MSDLILRCEAERKKLVLSCFLVPLWSLRRELININTEKEKRKEIVEKRPNEEEEEEEEDQLHFCD